MICETYSCNREAIQDERFCVYCRELPSNRAEITYFEIWYAEARWGWEPFFWDWFRTEDEANTAMRDLTERGLQAWIETAEAPA